MARLTIDLPIKERNALLRLARREMRNPRAQAALILRRELERAGLLPADQAPMSADMPAEREPQAVPA